MDANIRELKANLSGVIRRVEAGETVTVHVRNRPVARIVPVSVNEGLKSLTRLPGLTWKGGKPRGLENGERLPTGVSLGKLVVEDRR